MASEHEQSHWAVYDLPLQERSRAACASEAAEEIQRMLLRNGEWFCSLRWLVIGAFCILALTASLAGDRLARHGIYLTPGWPTAVAGVLAVFNVGYVALARGMRTHPKWRGRLARADLWLQILFDLAVLTVVVHYVGSLETYAPMMYLFHIVLACIFYPPGQSLLVTLSAMGMYLACVLLESTGVVARQSLWAAAFLPDGGAASPTLLAWHVGSVLFISGTVWYLACAWPASCASTSENWPSSIGTWRRPRRSAPAICCAPRINSRPPSRPFRPMRKCSWAVIAGRFRTPRCP